MSVDRSRIASDYDLYMAVCGNMIAVECGGIPSLIDNTSGRIQVDGGAGPDNCTPEYIAHWRQFEVSTGVVVMPHADAYEILEEIGGIGCETSMQLRSCKGGQVYIEHLSGVVFDNIQRSNLTASGPNEQDGVSLATMPFVWRKLTQIKTPQITILDNGGNTIEDTIVDLAYCDCPSCCNCSADCQTVYRITETGRLDVSNDGGQTWEETLACLPATPIKLICVNGTLFSAHENGDIYLSSDPVNTVDWLKVGNNNGRILDVAHSGLTLYLLHTDGRISRMNSSRKLELVRSETSDLNRIAASDSIVVAVGDNSNLIYSEDSGITWTSDPFSYAVETNTDLIAVNLAKNHPTATGCFRVIVANQDNELYRTENFTTWEKISTSLGDSEASAPAHIESFLEGFIVWYSRVIDGNTTIHRFNGAYCDLPTTDSGTISENCCDMLPDQPMFVCLDEDGCLIESVIAIPSDTIPDDFDFTLYGCYEPFDPCDENECTEIIVFDCNKKGCGQCDESIYIGLPKSGTNPQILADSGVSFNEVCGPNGTEYVPDICDCCDLGGTPDWPACYRPSILGCFEGEDDCEDEEACFCETDTVTVECDVEGIPNNSIVMGYETDTECIFYSCDICHEDSEYVAPGFEPGDDCLLYLGNEGVTFDFDVEICGLLCVDTDDTILMYCEDDHNQYILMCDFDDQWNNIPAEDLAEGIENGFDCILPTVAQFDIIETIDILGDPCEVCQEACEAELTTRKVNAFAVCPQDINIAIASGSEAITIDLI